MKPYERNDMMLSLAMWDRAFCDMADGGDNQMSPRSRRHKSGPPKLHINLSPTLQWSSPQKTPTGHLAFWLPEIRRITSPVTSPIKTEVFTHTLKKPRKVEWLSNQDELVAEAYRMQAAMSLDTGMDALRARDEEDNLKEEKDLDENQNVEGEEEEEQDVTLEGSDGAESEVESQASVQELEEQNQMDTEEGVEAEGEVQSQASAQELEEQNQMDTEEVVETEEEVESQVSVDEKPQDEVQMETEEGAEEAGKEPESPQLEAESNCVTEDEQQDDMVGEEGIQDSESPGDDAVGVHKENVEEIGSETSADDVTEQECDVPDLVESEETYPNGPSKPEDLNANELTADQDSCPAEEAVEDKASIDADDSSVVEPGDDEAAVMELDDTNSNPGDADQSLDEAEVETDPEVPDLTVTDESQDLEDEVDESDQMETVENSSDQADQNDECDIEDPDAVVEEEDTLNQEDPDVDECGSDQDMGSADEGKDEVDGGHHTEEDAGVSDDEDLAVEAESGDDGDPDGDPEEAETEDGAEVEECGGEDLDTDAIQDPSLTNGDQDTEDVSHFEDNKDDISEVRNFIFTLQCGAIVTQVNSAWNGQSPTCPIWLDFGLS